MDNNGKSTFKERLNYWFKIKFKIRVSRFFVMLRKRRRSPFIRIPQTNNMQNRAIDLFYALLKSKKTNLNYSPNSGMRIIDSENVWVTLSRAINSTCTINIIEENEKDEAHSHEVSVPVECVYDMIEEFDNEMERRFRAAEASRKRIVVDDLEKLIKQFKNG